MSFQKKVSCLFVEGKKKAKMNGKDNDWEAVRRCTYCNAIENQVRMVGNFVVELTEIEIGTVEKLACQSCKIKVKEAREAIQKNIGF